MEEEIFEDKKLYSGLQVKEALDIGPELYNDLCVGGSLKYMQLGIRSRRHKGKWLNDFLKSAEG